MLGSEKERTLGYFSRRPFEITINLYNIGPEKGCGCPSRPINKSPASLRSLIKKGQPTISSDFVLIPMFRVYNYASGQHTNVPINELRNWIFNKEGSTGDKKSPADFMMRLPRKKER